MRVAREGGRSARVKIMVVSIGRAGDEAVVVVVVVVVRVMVEGS